MVTSPHHTDIPVTGDIERALVKTCREPQQDEQIHFMSNEKCKEENETGDRATITLDEAARLLNISTTTAKLWSNMGLLKTSISHGKRRMVSWADILTFLPAEIRTVFFMERRNNKPVDAGLIRQKRQKLAEMNVRAITRLTKQSVSKISHLGDRPMARIGK